MHGTAGSQRASGGDFVELISFNADSAPASILPYSSAQARRHNQDATSLYLIGVKNSGCCGRGL
jgi:hypothetical protein